MRLSRAQKKKGWIGIGSATCKLGVLSALYIGPCRKTKSTHGRRAISSLRLPLYSARECFRWLIEN